MAFCFLSSRGMMCLDERGKCPLISHRRVEDIWKPSSSSSWTTRVLSLWEFSSWMYLAPSLLMGWCLYFWGFLNPLGMGPESPVECESVVRAFSLPPERGGGKRRLVFRVVTKGLTPRLVEEVCGHNFCVLEEFLELGVLFDPQMEIVTDCALPNFDSIKREGRRWGVGVRQIVVPSSYECPRGSKFKARALHYANVVSGSPSENTEEEKEKNQLQLVAHSPPSHSRQESDTVDLPVSVSATSSRDTVPLMKPAASSKEGEGGGGEGRASPRPESASSVDSNPAVAVAVIGGDCGGGTGATAEACDDADPEKRSEWGDYGVSLPAVPSGRGGGGTKGEGEPGVNTPNTPPSPVNPAEEDRESDSDPTLSACDPSTNKDTGGPTESPLFPHFPLKEDVTPLSLSSSSLPPLGLSSDSTAFQAGGGREGRETLSSSVEASPLLCVSDDDLIIHLDEETKLTGESLRGILSLYTRRFLRWEKQKEKKRKEQQKEEKQKHTCCWCAKRCARSGGQPRFSEKRDRAENEADEETGLLFHTGQTEVAEFDGGKKEEKEEGDLMGFDCCGQGIIVYGQEYSIEFLPTTMADSTRILDDYTRFRLFFTTAKAAVQGMKGSFIVVPARFEREGREKGEEGTTEGRRRWASFDVGPAASITEDAAFGLQLMEKGVPLEFIRGVMNEKSPFSLSDFVKQRARWISGLWKVALDSGSLRLSSRLPLLLAVSLYSLVPINLVFGHVVIVTTQILHSNAPPTWAALVFCTSMQAMAVWGYAFGAMQNFSLPRPFMKLPFVDRVEQVLRKAVLVLVCALLVDCWLLMEAAGTMYAFATWSSSTKKFHIVKKETAGMRKQRSRGEGEENEAQEGLENEKGCAALWGREGVGLSKEKST
uniref:Glycosyltransferase 2-like domain-containing protein n=1 Tax=Chromera velia CCMP2878 TaxID=1169474 RepID=A0A0G4GXH2_9ALVE|eukprot:Cvel_23730.t1-p1 / transcript=Cvel_23730.t1 / gene=Cvel_23730 / organism=Chromera_velia_CCMP2878 / gene_product=Beta-1,4-mannosyltransferase egh, putative / transcript_product=Beta-1,4-mannosyltransferase egh, putative / location=Cvel_scaffold2480:23674-27200(-) / protein_length=881 / sequence_SO=supercontig / SO=protein_coding / is_pseudo=false